MAENCGLLMAYVSIGSAIGGVILDQLVSHFVRVQTLSRLVIVSEVGRIEADFTLGSPPSTRRLLGQPAAKYLYVTVNNMSATKRAESCKPALCLVPLSNSSKQLVVGRGFWISDLEMMQEGFSEMYAHSIPATCSSELICVAARDEKLLYFDEGAWKTLYDGCDGEFRLIVGAKADNSARSLGRDFLARFSATANSIYFCASEEVDLSRTNVTSYAHRRYCT